MLDAIRRNAQSWGIKIAFGIIILVFLFWGLGQKGNDAKQVVAYVNDKPVLISEYQRSYTRAVENMRRQNPNLSTDDLKRVEFKKQLLNQMVQGQLLRDEAGRMGLAVSAAEVRDAIGQLPAFQNDGKKFDPQIYQAVLQANRISPAEFEGQFRQSLLQQKLEGFVGASIQVTEAEARDMYAYAQEQTRVDYVLFDRAAYEGQISPSQAEIEAFYAANQDQFMDPARIKLEYLLLTPATLAKNVKVSDEDVKAYYEARKDKFVQEEAVRAHHILVKVAPDARDEDVAKAKDEALKLAARVQKGEKFEDVARKGSQSPDAVQGGDLGWFGRGQMIKPFEEVAFGLKPGQVSSPVRTEFGFHLIRVDERREGGQQTLDQVKDEIRKTLAEEKSAEGLAQLADSIMDKVLGGTELKTAAADAGLSLETADFFTKAQGLKGVPLPPAALDTLFRLPVGGATDTPVTVEDGYLFARKVEEKPEAVQPLDAVKAKIVQQLKTKGAGEIAQKKAQDLADRLAKGEAPGKDAAIKQSELFGRRGLIPGLGMNPELVEEAFKSEPDKWLAKPFAVISGYAVVRTNKKVAPAEDKWAKEKDVWVQMLSQNKKQEMFQAFTTELVKKADIRIVNQAVLND